MRPPFDFTVNVGICHHFKFSDNGEAVALMILEFEFSK